MMKKNGSTTCVIDAIVKSNLDAYIVFEDTNFIAFLDHHPIFFGHTLLAPKNHYQTIYDLPKELVGAFFYRSQLLAQAIQKAMQAQGIFMAINTIISQSIPHLHLHIIPRNKGDGLKGFFWPRSHYKNDDEAKEVQEKIILAQT